MSNPPIDAMANYTFRKRFPTDNVAYPSAICTLSFNNFTVLSQGLHWPDPLVVTTMDPSDAYNEVGCFTLFYYDHTIWL